MPDVIGQLGHVDSQQAHGSGEALLRRQLENHVQIGSFCKPRILAQLLLQLPELLGDTKTSVADYAIHQLHARAQMPLLPCHPRDLLSMALDQLAYNGDETDVDEAALDWAWENYFLQEQDEPKGEG